MDPTQFAKILVEEVVDRNPPDSRLFIDGCGIDSTNLDDADEIWKVFVRYNVDAYGVKSSTVYKFWNDTPEGALIKQRNRLVEKTELLNNLECYKNFTFHCPVTYKSGNFIDQENCHCPEFFDDCPVVNLIKELKWHRKHYTVAKILVEDTKRLLIENSFGKHRENLNDIVNGYLKKYFNEKEGNKRATKDILCLFNDMKGYGTPPKVITWFLTELSSPVHQVNHWPDLDYSQLNPVDTHVDRLMTRFKFYNDNNEIIDDRLKELYPDEPRKLDFALYRLGGESEEGICGSEPKCDLCKQKYPSIYENCYADVKKIIK